MNIKILPAETNGQRPGESEQGLLLAILVMVVLGVAGMFLISG